LIFIIVCHFIYAQLGCYLLAKGVTRTNLGDYVDNMKIEVINYMDMHAKVNNKQM